MTKITNKKSRNALLVVLEYLIKNTDAEHGSKHEDICRYAKLKGVPIERETVSKILLHIEELGKLNKFPIKIKPCEGFAIKRYYVAENFYTNDELIMIIESLRKNKQLDPIECLSLENKTLNYFTNSLTQPKLEADLNARAPINKDKRYLRDKETVKLLLKKIKSENSLFIKVRDWAFSFAKNDGTCDLDTYKQIEDEVSAGKLLLIPLMIRQRDLYNYLISYSPKYNDLLFINCASVMPGDITIAPKIKYGSKKILMTQKEIDEIVDAFMNHTLDPSGDNDISTFTLVKYHYSLNSIRADATVLQNYWGSALNKQAPEKVDSYRYKFTYQIKTTSTMFTRWYDNNRNMGYVISPKVFINTYYVRQMELLSKFVTDYGDKFVCNINLRERTKSV